MNQYEGLRQLCAVQNCPCHLEEPMAAHTTFRIGGPCRAFVTLTSPKGLSAVISHLRAHEMPYRVIGRGSNLLVPDAGYDGVVLRLMEDAPEHLRVDSQACTILCGAGTPLKQLCMVAQQHGLAGLEFAYGIPGSIGGAVFMNAGAYGGEVSQVMRVAYLLDAAGEEYSRTQAEMEFSYRHSILMEERDSILTCVLWQLMPGDAAEIQAKMQDYLHRRQEKQPLEYPSAGSTFKRPAGSYASMLIDQCGLKGYTVGGAQVSEKHAGFVINRGGATFSDVMAVCDHVRETIQRETGYVLELEPEILQ